MYAATAMLAALEHRRVSGRGQYIDLALLDCVVALNSYQATELLPVRRDAAAHGNAHTNMVPYQAFACRDGHVIVAVGNDSQFASFCRVIDRAELAADEASPRRRARAQPRRADPTDRSHHARAYRWQSGSRAWRPPTCPAADLRHYRRCSRIRRSPSAA